MYKNLKLKKLERILKDLESVVIAYSGGVDSTFLLKTAVSVLGKDKVLAVTAVSETYPSTERDAAKALVKKIDAYHRIISTRELDIKNFKDNPINRCYFCKKELFGKLKRIADKKKLKNVIDGSNVDDKNDWRAGSIAAKELGIRSPLAESGFTKNNIRNLSRKLGLITWNKPSFACLASRFPYGQKITKEKLSLVEEAENYLRKLGFRQVRVRCYDRLARIEVEPRQLKRLTDFKEKIIKRLKELGFIYITLDLSGYRTGSMNEAINSTI